jgi:SAM domain (Sterile alpha motif)
MSEVRKWLEAIGLSQYTDAFETNDLEIDLLQQVDDQLLKDIGVASAGHRLRIRNAIAKLEAKVPSETADGSLTAPRMAERQQRYQLCRSRHRYQSQAWSNQKANAGT